MISAEALIERELPDGWQWRAMGDIAEVVSGGTPSTSDPSNFEGGDIPWVTPADLSGYTAKHFSRGARQLTRKGLQSCSARMLPAGTILFTSRAPVGYVAIASNPIATNQGFKSFVLREDVLPDYAYWWLKGAKQLAESLASGTTFLELSGANAKKLPIPVAPLEEQRRIVAEIEKQFSRLDEAVANLQRVKANLKRYKAAVLKAAVEGRLVETEAELARRGGFEFESASDLVTRCAEVLGSGVHRKKPLSFAPPEDGFSALPEGWTWVAVEQLAAREVNSLGAGPFGTIFKAKDFRSEGVPIIFLRHVAPLQYLSHKPGFMDTDKWEELFKPYSVFGGELLITKLGEPPGVCAKYPTGVGPAMVTPDVIKLSVNADIVISEYLMYYFNSEPARRFATGAAFGTTRTRLTLPLFREMPVPLPPLAEQTRIVAEVDRRLSIIREVELEVDADLQRAQTLRSSVLSRAFSCDGTAQVSSAQDEHVAHLPVVDRPVRFEPASVVMAARVLDALAGEPTLGRVKLQKIVFLATYHGKIESANAEYVRMQAGPLDMLMLEGVIKRLNDLGWFREIARNGKSNQAAYSYAPLTKAGEHRKHLAALTAEQIGVIDQLVRLMRTWSTEQCELLATVYGAWNDLLIWKRPPTVDAIAHEVLENWHEAKRKFSRQKISQMIEEIKRLGIEPSGFGLPMSGSVPDVVSKSLFES